MSTIHLILNQTSHFIMEIICRFKGSQCIVNVYACVYVCDMSSYLHLFPRLRHAPPPPLHDPSKTIKGFTHALSHASPCGSGEMNTCLCLDMYRDTVTFLTNPRFHKLHRKAFLSSVLNMSNCRHDSQGLHLELYEPEMCPLKHNTFIFI